MTKRRDTKRSVQLGARRESIRGLADKAVQRTEKLFGASLSEVPAKRWKSAFDAAVRAGAAGNAIALVFTIVEHPTKLSDASRSKLLAEGAQLAMDLALGSHGRTLAEAYLSSSKTTAKVKRDLTKRLEGLDARCEHAADALARIEDGEGDDVDEEGWSVWAQRRLGSNAVRLLATDPSSGAVVAARRPLEVDEAPSGSSEAILYHDGMRIVPIPAAYRNEGNRRDEPRVDTGSFVDGATLEQHIYRGSRRTYRHFMGAGRNVRFFCVYDMGPTYGQGIRYRHWLRCDDDDFARRLMDMARKASWAGTRLADNVVSDRLVVESYYGAGIGSAQLARMDDIVVDTPTQEVTFEIVRLLDFLKEHYRTHRRSYPLVDECLSGNLAINVGGKLVVRFPPMKQMSSVARAEAFLERRRHELWRSGMRLTGFDEVPLGRP